MSLVVALDEIRVDRRGERDARPSGDHARPPTLKSWPVRARCARRPAPSSPRRRRRCRCARTCSRAGRPRSRPAAPSAPSVLLDSGSGAENAMRRPSRDHSKPVTPSRTSVSCTASPPSGRMTKIWFLSPTRAAHERQPLAVGRPAARRSRTCRRASAGTVSPPRRRGDPDACVTKASCSKSAFGDACRPPTRRRARSARRRPFRDATGRRQWGCGGRHWGLSPRQRSGR